MRGGGDERELSVVMAGILGWRLEHEFGAEWDVARGQELADGYKETAKDLL